MQVTTLGIDLAKNVFRLHGCDANGRGVLRKQLGRRQLLAFMANLPPCLVAMEACATAHYWAREIEKVGHRVRLIGPKFVKPYVKANKNDASDAEAICEAATRPSMRFVAIKSSAQQDIQAVHRVRQQLVKTRTALVNQARGLLAENGIVLAQGVSHLRRALPSVVADDGNGLSGAMRELLVEIRERLSFVEEHLHQYDLRIQRLFHADERCRRLAEVEGVGPLVATALVAAVGNAGEFRSGRELAAYLGLVPRHRASGGRTTLLGISKRGDRYLRTLLVHGARSALWTIEQRRSARGVWAARLKLRGGTNIAAVALANKNARVLWALLRRGDSYRPALTRGCAGCSGKRMANRSDRHSPEPVGGSGPRGRNSDQAKVRGFPSGPGAELIAPYKRGRIYDCNRIIAHQTPQTGLRWGAVHI
jgi:transposase